MNKVSCSLKLISFNVNGIRAVIKKGLLSWLSDSKPDILCLQETKAQVEQIPEEIKNLTGYHQYYVSAQKKGYSGVATLSRRKPENVQYGLGHERFDSEGRTLITDFGDFLLLNIYFPNGKASSERLDYKLDFYEELLLILSDLLSQGRKIILCGDVNTAHREIDLARPKENENTSGFLPREREWIDRLLDAGFVDSLRVFHPEEGQYSWWDYKTRARERNVGWRIDYFFVSENMKTQLKDAFILSDVEGSDHCPVGIEIEI